MSSTLKNKILFKRSELESNIIDNTTLQNETLHGELILCYEKDKERLYCKNSDGLIVPIENTMDCGVIDDGLSVDLGLSVEWAKTNLGANSPEEAGLYFQWGDTQGYTAEQVGKDKLFASNFSDYKFSIDGSSSNFSKYNATDGLTKLDLEDDAAHVMLGGNWRMPTYEECLELYKNTDIFLVLEGGQEIAANADSAQTSGQQYTIPWSEEVPSGATISGCKFCNKSDVSKYIFVPAAGYASHFFVSFEGVDGYCWSSSLSLPYVNGAWNYGFYDNVCLIKDAIRCYGVGIRPVRPKN